MNDSSSPPSTRRLVSFFVPLALQAASQSLSYPLIAMVASHGPGGALNLAGVVQANLVMFLVGTLGAGLVTAGMVFARTREGYATFVRVNRLLAVSTALLQAVLCIPAAGHLLFSTLLGLPLSIEAPAVQAFPLTIPLNLLFYARNPYQVQLYNHGASGRASIATFSRIGLILLLAPLFCFVGLVGPRWALVCQMIPVGSEVAISWWYSRPFVAGLPGHTGVAPTGRKLLLFTLPLALGGALMTLSGMFLGAVIARAGEPERMLPAYYLAVGLANPVAYAAHRVENVVLAFPPRSHDDNQTLRFAVVAGAVLALIPWVFLLPGLADWYYISLQRLPAADLTLVKTTALMLVGFPFSVALRCHREGLAALQHRTPSILAGDITYMAALALVASLCLTLQAPGNVIGPIAMATSNLASLGMLMFLLRKRRDDVGPTVAPIVSEEG